MNRKHANPAEDAPHQGEQGISNRPDDEEPIETATDEDDEDFEDDEDEDESEEESDDESDEEA